MSTKADRMMNEGAEIQFGIRHRILDKGYVELVEYSGCDNTVVTAARHSYR